MGDLSKNFSRHEFACQCGCGFDTVDAELINVLQDLRDHFGPVEISGPNRCPVHNREIGGAQGSLHQTGKAADIKIDGTDPQTVFSYLDHNNPQHYGIGLYCNRVHIDVRPHRARWST